MIEIEDGIRHLISTSVPLSTVISNENNKEEITLIWYDKNFGIGEDNKKTAELLQQMNDYVLICSNRETFNEYINQIKTEKVLMILSGTNAEDILDDIHDNKQIDSIYIFCMKREKYEIYLNDDKYYKLIDIYTEYETLLTAIQENIRHLRKQSEAAGLFDQDERSIRHLNKEQTEFNFFRSFKYILTKNNADDEQSKHEMIEICRHYYRRNQKELKNIDEFEHTYKPEDAIHWYTKETFVYRLVNKALRTEDIEALVILRFFIRDLCENLKNQYDILKQRQEHNPILLLYRGLKLTPPEIYNLKSNVGQIIATNGFLSTSRSKNVAYSFAKKGKKRLNVEIVMLEIEVDTSLATVSLADVAKYSPYPHEEEILFDLGAIFTIDSVTYNEDEKIWYIKLVCVPDDVLPDVTQTITEKYADETDMNIMLGKLLYIQGDYEKCVKYFIHLLNVYQNDKSKDGNLAKIYYSIAEAYDLLDKDDDAILYYNLAFDQYLSSNNLFDAARMLLDIGVVYLRKHDYDQANNYFTKSYNMKRDDIELPSNHCEIALSINSFGILCNSQNDYENALNYYMKSLNIYEDSSLLCKCKNHDSGISQQCENIAAILTKLNDDDKALEYLQKSLDLREKHLTSLRDRRSRLRTLKKMIQIFEKRNDEINIKICFKKMSKFDEYYATKKLAEQQAIQESIKTTLVKEEEDNFGQLLVKYYDHKFSHDDILEDSLISLKMCEKIQPIDLKQIANLHYIIGIIYSKAGHDDWALEHFQKAFDHYQKALSFFEIHLPVEFDKITSIAYNLFEIYLKKNDYENAMTFGMKSVNINPKISEKYSTDEEGAAQWYFDTGAGLMKQEPQKSFELIEKSLEIRQKLFNSDNVNIAFCHQNIGAIHQSYKLNFDKSIKHYQKAIEIYSKHLLDENKESSQYQGRIQKISEEVPTIVKKRFLKSIQDSITRIFSFLWRKNKIPDEVAVTESPTGGSATAQYDIKKCYATCLLNIGWCHLQMGELHYDNSMDYYSKALAIYEEEEEVVSNKESIAQCYQDMGYIRFSKGQYDKSIALLNKSIENRSSSSSSSEHDKNIAICHINLGCCYYHQKKYQRALEHALQAMETYQQDECNNGIMLGLIYKNIAEYNCKLENYGQALEFILKAKEIKGNDDATIHSTLALIYSNQHLFNKAVEHCNKTLDLVQQDPSSDHNADCYERLGEVYQDQNDRQKARQYYEKALDIYKKTLPSDHPIINRTVEILDNLLID